MQQLGFEMFLILLLFIVNGLFSMSEIAVVSARRVRLKKQAEEGDLGAKMALHLAEKPSRFLSTVQIGITSVGVFSGAYGAASISKPLAIWISRFETLTPHADSIALAIIVVIMTYFSLVIGELVPKSLALSHPEKIAAAVAIPMSFMSKMTAPLVWLLSVSTNFLVRLLNIKPPTEASITEDEIKAHIAHGTEIGVLDESEQDMIESVIRLDDQRIGALMTPRTEVLWLDINEPEDEIKRQIAASSYSRIPVAEESLDHIIGFVKSKDLLAQLLHQEPFDLRSKLNQPLFISETKTALEVLEQFKESKTHLAVVLNEFGVTEGIVTLNDMLEAIVGDLPHTGGDDEPLAIRREDGSWLLDARMSTIEFQELLNLNAFPEDEKDSYQTLAGFILTRLEKHPKSGDWFLWEGHRFEVVDMDGNRVDKILVILSSQDQNRSESELVAGEVY